MVASLRQPQSPLELPFSFQLPRDRLSLHSSTAQIHAAPATHRYRRVVIVDSVTLHGLTAPAGIGVDCLFAGRAFLVLRKVIAFGSFRFGILVVVIHKFI